MNELEDKIPSNNIDVPAEDNAVKSEEIVLPAPAPETRTRSILRSVLRWTLTLLITFGLGALTVYFVLVTPTNGELEQANIDLKQSSQEIESLENQIKDIEQNNQELKTQLDSVEIRLKLLSVISDVRAANLAVADDDYAGALLSINDASQTLSELINALDGDQNEVLSTMQDDLTGIEKALKSDPQTAQNNLERLTTNLIRLERAILK